MHDTGAAGGAGGARGVVPAVGAHRAFPLRLRIARDSGELSRVLSLFHRALRVELRRRARRLGLPVGEP